MQMPNYREDMMFYPYSNQLQTAAKSFNKGNFSLWFNKLIPLNNERNCKACNKQGNDKEAVQYYESFYNGLKNNTALKNLLDAKQKSQQHFCEIHEKAGYELINFKAELKSPLITGIGQTHPNEVGMVFDHTMGIPFIPASSVKGIVRFAHMLELIKSEDLDEYKKTDKEGEYIDESNLKAKIPAIFGGDADEEKKGGKKTKKLKGKVIFLDAYPEKIPALHVDIMNPHYGEYYSDENGKIPPADYLDPTPIKFLTVKQGTKFIFRALLPKDSDLLETVKIAFKNALENEGVGAKTAVGYGRFEIQNTKEKNSLSAQQQLQAKTPLEKMLDNLMLIKNTESGRIKGEIINNMEKELENNEDKATVAKAIKDKLDKRAFKKIDKKAGRYLSGLLAKIQEL
jgi:CRISPR-associated protein Cmr6